MPDQISVAYNHNLDQSVTVSLTIAAAFCIEEFSFEYCLIRYNETQLAKGKKKCEMPVKFYQSSELYTSLFIYVTPDGPLGLPSDTVLKEKKKKNLAVHLNVIGVYLKCSNSQ